MYNSCLLEHFLYSSQLWSNLIPHHVESSESDIKSDISVAYSNQIGDTIFSDNLFNSVLTTQNNILINRNCIMKHTLFSITKYNFIINNIYLSKWINVASNEGNSFHWFGAKVWFGFTLSCHIEIKLSATSIKNKSATNVSISLWMLMHDINHQSIYFHIQLTKSSPLILSGGFISSSD